jgi:hypothetical protein
MVAMPEDLKGEGFKELGRELRRFPVALSYKRANAIATIIRVRVPKILFLFLGVGTLNPRVCAFAEFLIIYWPIESAFPFMTIW